MLKSYNKKLKKLRLNPRLSLLCSSTLVLFIQLLTLHLYLGPVQMDWSFNVLKDDLTSKVSGK